MLLSFTEVTNNVGDFNKHFEILPDGSDEKSVSASIYDATGKTVTIDHVEIKDYLYSLNKQPAKALVLGVTGLPEFQIVTKSSGQSGENVVCRTGEFFKHVNSGNFGLMYFDVDGDWSQELIQEMLDTLDAVLSDALIPCGDSNLNPTSIMKWTKPSSSAGIVVGGKEKCGLHIFFPVRNPKEELIGKIFEYLWLQPGFRRHKVNAAGAIKPVTIIDKTVGGPEKPIFEADATVSGHVNLVVIKERDCKFVPGGAVDSELALEILKDLTFDFQREFNKYKETKVNSVEVQAARYEAKLARENRLRERFSDLDQKKLDKQWSAIVDKEVILSSDYLGRIDGTTVLVLDILLDRDKWINKDGFCDPIKWLEGEKRNVGMILGGDNGLILHSFNHGEVNYKLRFTPEDLETWANEAPIDEVEDWAGTFITQTEGSLIKVESISKGVAKRTGVQSSVVNKAVKQAQAEAVDEHIVDNELAVIKRDSTHQEVADHIVSRFEGCRVYGGKLYIWEEGGSIWKCYTNAMISSMIGRDYKFVQLNRTAPQNKQIASIIWGDHRVLFEEWPQEYGIPCHDGFYKMSAEGITRIGYKKELGCRYKLKFSPNSSVPTPNFDKLLKSVTGNGMSGNAILLQQVFGLTIGGYMQKLQKVPVLFGEGGLGKGIITKVLRALLPEGRVGSIPFEHLGDPEKINSLSGKVVNILDETQRRKPIDATYIKRLTGDNRVTGRELYVGTKEFKHYCSFWLLTNTWPKIDSVKEDMRRRFGDTIVHFVRSEDFGDDPDLYEKIVNLELPGILAWAINGARSYFEHGLVTDYSDEMWNHWCADADPISAFLDECYNIVGTRDKGFRGKWVARSECFARFKEWCKEWGFTEVSMKEFYSSLLGRRGIEVVKIGGTKVLKGLANKGKF